MDYRNLLITKKEEEMIRIILVTTVMLFYSASIKAQSSKTFFSDIDYDVTIGIGSTVCGKQYDEGKFSSDIGLDARKPVYELSEKSNIYCLVGLHYLIKGGNSTTDLAILIPENNASLRSSHLEVPVHVGITYKFSKCSVYLDCGLFFSTLVGDKTDKGTQKKSSTSGNKTNSTKKTTSLSIGEVGYGVYAGVRFKRFAIGFGSEQGITNYATYETDVKKISIKNTTRHFQLKWTF